MSADARTFYLIAVGGTAMTPLASLLIEKGHRVLGSDGPVYPPMSDRLAAMGIHVRTAFHEENLTPDVDEVVVGNVARKDNPELLAALRRGLRVRSMPETLHDEFLPGRHPVVVAGTHGKTTTTALIAWLLAAAGREPGFMVGGEPLNFDGPSALGRGPAFVVEGDEYSTSYADKGPKFLHYAPETLVLTSIEFDHADLYDSLAAVKDAFRKVVALVPPKGCIVANGDDRNVLDVLQGAPARIVLYGLRGGTAPAEERPETDLAAYAIEESPAGVTFGVAQAQRPLFSAVSPLAGRHNIANALAAIGAARVFGLTPAELAAGLASFGGVKRRLEVVGTAAGVIVLDDFAHHPTAVATTLAGAQKRYPGARVWAVFEPRSITGGRAEFAPKYLEALRGAGGVALAAPYHAARLSGEGGPGALDVHALADSLAAAGVPALAAADPDALLAALLPRLAPGDVVLAMSSGSFGGFHQKLLAGLILRAS
jgi:UDP-N-acetylmuramate: L-alanyl-gamma-D-glutamyl-meso-diaminopimelate ligase